VLVYSHLYVCLQPYVCCAVHNVIHTAQQRGAVCC
jgi:hypothetical protein